MLNGLAAPTGGLNVAISSAPVTGHVYCKRARLGSLEPKTESPDSTTIVCVWFVPLTQTTSISKVFMATRLWAEGLASQAFCHGRHGTPISQGSPQKIPARKTKLAMAKVTHFR